MPAPARVYIGLGSNLDMPVEQVRRGMTALRQLPESHVVRCSALYRTAPVGITTQPDFINAVCAVESRLAPDAMMRRLLAIEHAQGRTRGPIPGGPRTLDLDLLLYDDLEFRSPEVTLPHPRLHERAFVLYPLYEIAPTLYVPGRGPIAELLGRCENQGVTRISESDVTHPSTS